MKLLPSLALFSAALVLAGADTAHAQSEPIELFKQGDGDYALYRQPGIVRSKDGTLVAYAEGRKDLENSGWNKVDIFMRTSKDAGKTWSDPAKIAEAPADAKDNPISLEKEIATEGEIAVHNPTAVADTKNGGIHFLYTVEYSRVFHLKTDDAGGSAGEPVEITAVLEEFRPEIDWKVVATGPGHGIQLDSGRLVVPVWLSLGIHGIGMQPAACATIYSDDSGATWKRGEIFAYDVEITTAKTGSQLEKPSEAALAQAKDGTVVATIRNKDLKGQRAQSTSKDGATGWSEVTFVQGLMEPICFGSIAATDEGLLFANPNNMIMRRNLTVRLSTDSGATWPTAKTLDDGIVGYSDMVAGEGKSVHAVYESGANPGPTDPESIKFTTFTLDWLKE